LYYIYDRNGQKCPDSVNRNGEHNFYLNDQCTECGNFPPDGLRNKKELDASLTVLAFHLSLQRRVAFTYKNLVARRLLLNDATTKEDWIVAMLNASYVDFSELGFRYLCHPEN
jgi:hypothetical protein